MAEKTQKKITPAVQKTDEAPDFFEVLRQQHGSTVTYMRFYIQEDKYAYNPFHIKDQQEMSIEQEKTVQLSLPINRFIYNTVNDVLIGNKFVYNNSKIMNSVLESGRQIIHGRHVKKHFSWISFLNRPQFIMIKAAYQSLKQQDQVIIEYTVLAISNLILKLGINISKLSCILTQRKYTTRFLSIPTLSLLFLQYLMHNMFANKEISWEDDEGKSQYIRQLPKITYIKISQFINKQELLLMEIGQHLLFTSHAVMSKKVKNMQYLQFYQHEEQKGQKGYKKLTSYEHIHAINMSQVIEKGSPYGFELLLMFRTVYFHMIQEFNPDAIIFVEDYDNTKKVIEPQIRALLLSQIMENITGKVFVMREVGFRWDNENDVIDPVDRRHSHVQRHCEMNSEDMQNEQMNYSPSREQNGKMQEQTGNTKKAHETESMTVQEAQQFLVGLAKSMPKMFQQIQHKLDFIQDKTLTEAINIYNKPRNPKKIQYNYFQRVESVLRDDLAYIALALIQRTSFDQTIARSHRYIYQHKFIHNLISKITQELAPLGEVPQIHTNLEVSKSQLVAMLQNMNLQKLVFFKNHYDSVFFIPLDKSFELIVLRKDNTTYTVSYSDQDHVHVYYGPNGQLLVFLFKYSPVDQQEAQKGNEFIQKRGNFRQNTTLLRLCAPNLKNLEHYFFQPVFEDELILEDSTLSNPTFLITQEYIYRSFGTQKTQQKSPNQCKSQILRSQYRPFLSILNKKTKKQQLVEIESRTRTKNVLKWEPFTKCCPIYQKIQIPLMQKEYGWALYDSISKNAIFAGGYAPHGESRVNKYMHVFSEKEGQIKQMGKTSAEIFQGAKSPKTKISLFPFIYGISFTQQKSCIILNTNGFFQCFTNNNKLFLTELRMSQDSEDQKHGILSQRKLFVNYQDEDHRLKVVTTKQFIIHFIVNSYRLVNCYQNTCILQTLEEGTLTMKLIRNHVQGRVDFGISITTDRPEQNGEDFAVLEFRAYDI